MVLAKPENKHVLKAFDLTGKVAAITGKLPMYAFIGDKADQTGGARGIGLEVSRALAEAGANVGIHPSLLMMRKAYNQVALIYNSSTTADATAAEIASANNVKAAAYQANVSNKAEIERTIQQIASDFGRLDIIVVNSGITSNVAAEDYTAEQWKEIMQVNLDGAFYTAQAAAQIFKAQGRGNVIFTASVSATLVNVPQKQAAVCFAYVCNRSEIADGSSIMPRKRGWCSWLNACLSNG
jgi:NAD(P)-dependent dehydrogenase (short-subunit alcohol dehydrogenase family)